MKMWGMQNFANGSPVRYGGRLGMHAPSATPSPAIEPHLIAAHAQYAWVSSLPIAAAVFSHEGEVITQIESNQQFDAIVLGEQRETGLDMGEFAQRIDAMVRQARHSHFECWQSADPVNRRELEINIARFGEQQDKFLFSLVDRTAEATSRASLRREMLSDSLTGFFNRSGFEEEVEQTVTALAKNQSETGAGGNYAIILIDLARFSLVNESVGALAGDELIITVARRLYSRVRRNEILGRLGGNEFALFVDLDNAGECIQSITQRLSTALAEPCQLSGLEIQVECAFAAAIGEVTHDDASDIIRFAQIALKRAKTSKRFELYSAGGVDSSRHRFSIETDLRRAIQRNELELHYQPLMDMKSGHITGFEALARWQHPDLGFISPIDFIPVAEESGLIVPLGRWALEQAARTIRDWDSRATGELPFKISVNMSAVQMLRDDVVDAVSGALNGAGICGSRMTIELTESAFVSDPDGAKRILNALKALNTNLAMDDFGTGYSNLAYLQQLPIDVLKIDRSFINGMLENRDKRAIVRTVLSLARALGMQTTAEGIETAATSEALRKLGCSVGQGYFYARPLTAEAAYTFLADSRASATS
jgi:c-di-GMP phosphodiesterase Gmr